MLIKFMFLFILTSLFSLSLFFPAGTFALLQPKMKIIVIRLLQKRIYTCKFAIDRREEGVNL